MMSIRSSVFWKESPSTRAYMTALLSSVPNLYEVSDIVNDTSFKAWDLVQGAGLIKKELQYCVEVGLLCRRRQIADRHVFDHAAAKRADLGHRKTSCLKGWACKTLDPLRQEAPTVTVSPQLPRQPQ